MDIGRILATGNELSEKVILVTGASKGIGAAIVTALGEQGAFIIAHYGRDRDGVEKALQGIDLSKKLIIQSDLAIDNGFKKLWDEALAWKGRVHVLVANAGVMPEAAITDSDEIWSSAWESAFAVNVRSSAFLIREATLHFLNTGGGVIIGITSWAAQRGSGNPKLAGYAASKAPIAALLKTIAKNYAKQNIYAYLIAPGIVRTAMSEASAKSMGGEEALTSTLAMGEWVPPSEIASLVTFLSTGTRKHLTGSTFDINGATYIR